MSYNVVDLPSTSEPALPHDHDIPHPSNLPTDDESPQLDPLTPARASPSQQAPPLPPPIVTIETTEQPSFYDLPDNLTLKVRKNIIKQLTCVEQLHDCHRVQVSSMKRVVMAVLKKQVELTQRSMTQALILRPRDKIDMR